MLSALQPPVEAFRQLPVIPPPARRADIERVAEAVVAQGGAMVTAIGELVELNAAQARFTRWTQLAIIALGVVGLIVAVVLL